MKVEIQYNWSKSTKLLNKLSFSIVFPINPFFSFEQKIILNDRLEKLVYNSFFKITFEYLFTLFKLEFEK